MKILYVHDYGETGAGAEASLLLLLNHIPSEGVKPICALPVGGELAKAISSRNIPVKHIPLKTLAVRSGKMKAIESLCRLGVSMLSLCGLVQREKPAVIHANSFLALLCSFLPSLLFSVPVVCHIRLFIRASWANRSALKFLGRRGVVFIAISDAVKQHLVSLGVNAHQIRRVYNAVNVDDYDTAGATLKQAWGFSHDQRVVGVVGQIAVHKGQDIFLQSAALIREVLPDVRFVVVGERVTWPGPFQYASGQLAELARELGISETVKFVGHQDDIPAVMRSLDLLVVPSLIEPFGRVVIEAMAARTPVVASKVGGIPELIRDDIDGSLVDPGEPQAIADSVVTILENQEYREKLVHHARARAEHLFGVTSQITTIGAIYREATSRIDKKP